MYFEVSDLLWLCFLSFAGWHWWQGQKVKEIALKSAIKYCKEVDIQLLDQSIYLRGFWFKRDSDGKLRIWRSYQFDFTATGDDRAKGRVVMLGYKLTNIELDAHRI